MLLTLIIPKSMLGLLVKTLESVARLSELDNLKGN